MRSTKVGADGNVRCPKCGAVNSFTSKRTGKAKLGAGLLGVATFGVAGLAAPVVMPKRLKCNGCGKNLKRG
jgi:phage FluMu protein Com